MADALPTAEVPKRTTEEQTIPVSPQPHVKDAGVYVPSTVSDASVRPFVTPVSIPVPVNTDAKLVGEAALEVPVTTSSAVDTSPIKSSDTSSAATWLAEWRRARGKAA